MSASVGQEVDSICGKCKDTTIHIILAMVGDAIAKVQCKRCDAQHRYRPPKDSQSKTKVKTKSSKPKAAPRRGSKKRRALIEPTIEPNLDREIAPYSLFNDYEPGDRISHPKFGDGLVEEITGDNKMQVFFEDERRMMIFGKKK